MRPQRRRQPQPSIQSFYLPGPSGGLNTITPGHMLPEGDCLRCFNLIAGEHGLRSRLGEREWCTGLTGGLTNEVRTLIPYIGSAANGTSNRLFACTSTGIWDVSASSTSPTQLVAFATTSEDAGFGICHAMVTAGGHFLLYCDEENGYHVYTEATDTWAKVAAGAGAGQLAGVDPASVVFVTVWKSRVWFVEKNSARVWYLPAGTIYGTAQKLDLDKSAQFRGGGPVVGLWNWTLDGGVGIDDHLVAVSQGGDVAVYQGSDPASAATFAIKGTWQVGSVPSGRHIATNLGGDVLIASKSGLWPVSQLVAGGDGAGTYAPSKVANLFNQLALTRSSLPGWGLYIHPEDNALLVTIPTESGDATEQLVQSLWNRSWSRYRDLPIFSGTVWEKQFYFGTVDGRVCINDGAVDGVTLADPDAFEEIEYSLLTAFRNMGSPRMKQVQFIRPTLLSETGTPAYQVEARYGYDLREASAPAAASSGGNTWDAGVWDDAEWTELAATQAPRGATGMGVDVAIALRGTAVSRTVVVGFDVVYTEGGVL